MNFPDGSDPIRTKGRRDIDKRLPRDLFRFPAVVRRDYPPLSGNARVTQTAFNIIERQQRLATQPARDDQMALIWPPWNVLPSEMEPEEKRWILTGGLPESNRGHRKRLNKLKVAFPHLPFDKNKFNQALLKAVEWSKLVRYSRTTFRLHHELVEQQLAYSNFDDVNTGRVAIFRATNELQLTNPGLLRRPAPTLADIKLFSSRYADYLRARMDTINLLKPLIFLPRLRVKETLSPEEKALGLPHPPQNFPNHIYIARLAALGKCTPERLAGFFPDLFLKLSRHEKDQFCNEYHEPTKWRDSNYLFLAVWLADNAPVFKAFAATWKDIRAAACKRFNSDAPEGYRSCHQYPDKLKIWWKDYEDRFWPKETRRISPPPGRPRTESARLDWDSLLTPLPFVTTRKG